MLTDEITLEVELAQQLDEIAGELNGIAEQLRRKPYVAVEGQLISQQERLAAVMGLGEAVKENAS